MEVRVGARRFLPLSFLISLHAFPAKRQGASADELPVRAARILPLVGPARSKQDPITCGPRCLVFIPPLPAGASYLYLPLCTQ